MIMQKSERSLESSWKNCQETPDADRQNDRQSDKQKDRRQSIGSASKIGGSNNILYTSNLNYTSLDTKIKVDT